MAEMLLNNLVWQHRTVEGQGVYFTIQGGYFAIQGSYFAGGLFCCIELDGLNCMLLPSF